MSSIRSIREAMKAALDEVMGPDALGEDAIQVSSRLNFEPQAPTSVDIYFGDAFRGTETAGFGERMGELIFTVRCRVTNPDSDAAQDQLEALLDDEHDLCLAAALEQDATLGGIVSQLVVDGDTGQQIFDDPPAAMLGCQWRVRVTNATS